MNKAGRIMEYIWLILGIASMGLGIHGVITHGLKKSYVMFIIATISFAMYFLRYYLRKSQR